MSQQTDFLGIMLEPLLGSASARVRVETSGEPLLFEVRPEAAGVIVIFGAQLWDQLGNLEFICAEAARAALDVLAGRTLAAKLRRRAFEGRQQVLDAIALSMRVRAARRRASGATPLWQLSLPDQEARYMNLARGGRHV